MVRTLALSSVCLWLAGCAEQRPPAQSNSFASNLSALIAALDGDSLEDRDRAFQAIVAIGVPTLPMLREAAQSGGTDELRSRARDAIAAIAYAERLRGKFPEPRRMTLALQGSLGEAAEILGSHFGTKIRLEGVPADVAVSIHLDKATWFETLETLCAGGDLAWGERLGNAILWKRRRSQRTSSFRTNYFYLRAAADPKTPHEFDLSFYHEPQLDVLPMFKLDGLRSFDGDGHELPLTMVDKGYSWMSSGGAVRMSFYVVERSPEFVMRDPNVKSVARFQGTATFRFPDGVTKMEFDREGGTSDRRMGDLQVRIEDWSDTGCTLVVDTGQSEWYGDLLGEVQGWIHFGDAVFTDEAGDSVSAVINSWPETAVVSDAPPLRYPVSLKGEGGRKLRKLTLQVVNQVLEQRVPFEIRDIQLSE